MYRLITFVKVVTMLENENISQGEDSLRSFCSSCKSSLRSIYSIGIPSYLNACSTSTSQDHLQEIADAEIMQLDSSALKTHNSNKSLIYVPSRESTENLSKNANNSLSPLHVDDSNRENQTNETRKVNDANVSYYLKDRTTIIDDVREHPILTNLCESCSNTLETKKPLKPALNTRNLIEGLKETCDALSQINAKVRAMIALKEDNSQNSVSLKTTETDIVTRRRNIYNTAVRLSSKLRSVNKIINIINSNLIES